MELTAGSIMKTMFELKFLVPNADLSHMVRVEPDLLVVGSKDLDTIKYGGTSVMTTLREITAMPEPCVRLLVYEEPGLLLGKGGMLRMEQVRLVWLFQIPNDCSMLCMECSQQQVSPLQQVHLSTRLFTH